MEAVAAEPLAWILARRSGLWELSASPRLGGGRLAVAAALLAAAQRRGEPVAWVGPRGGSTPFPPDLERAGVCLRALPFVRPPGGPGAPRRLGRAAEILLRSGAFGWVVLDLADGAPPGLAWSSRLAAVAERHAAAVVALTAKEASDPSLGPRVRLRLQVGPCPHAPLQRLRLQVVRCRGASPPADGALPWSGPPGLLAAAAGRPSEAEP